MAMNTLPTWSIFVINLERSQDRLKLIADQFRDLKLSFQRVEAVDGQTLSKTDINQYFDLRKYHLKHGKEPVPGEIGCYLSHIRALHAFLKTPTPYGLILEDDAYPPSNLEAILRELETYAYRWDVVKLSGVHRGTPIRIAKLSTQRTLCAMLTQCTGSSAYAVQREAAQKYLNNLLPMSLPFDHEFDQGWKYHLRVRYVLPFPFTHQQNNNSTIISHRSRKLSGHQRIPKHLFRASTELIRLAHNSFDALRSIVTRH